MANYFIKDITKTITTIVSSMWFEGQEDTGGEDSVKFTFGSLLTSIKNALFGDISLTQSVFKLTDYYMVQDGSDVKKILGSVLLDGIMSQGFPDRIIPGTLVLSYSNTTTFGVSAGKAKDSTFSYGLNLTSAFTKTLSAWAVGTGNGSLDTGSVAASTTYHVYLIKKDSDGTIDVLISTNATSPTMPSGYTYKRRIGCFRTNGSSQIIKFYQHGNMFRFDAQIEDRASTALANTNRILVTTSVPESMIGIFNIMAVQGSSAAYYYFIAQATEETDSAASISNSTHRLYAMDAPNNVEMKINIDSSRQIAIRGTSTNILCRIGTLGWIDPLL